MSGVMDSLDGGVGLLDPSQRIGYEHLADIALILEVANHLVVFSGHVVRRDVVVEQFADEV